MRADVASRAPRGRKHGAAFAETWTTHDKTLMVAVGVVLAGADPVQVGDLLRTGARALVASRSGLQPALVALDKLVLSHAREHRDDELAAAIVLLAFPAGTPHVDVAGAGRLHAAIVNGVGEQRALHGHAGALGTGIELSDVVASYPLRHDDLVVAATVPIAPRWWESGKRTAEELLAHGGDPEAAAAVVSGD